MEEQLTQNPMEKTKRKYRRKDNLKRFFRPQEWFNFINQVKREHHKFFLEFILHTGCRINEARGIELRDINFQREEIMLRKTKGGAKKNRTIQISTYLAGRIKSYISYAGLTGNETKLGFPSTVMMDKMIKRYGKLAGIQDYEDFSNHNFRKTLENWLIALNINHFSVQAHMGHTIEVASAHYVATQLLNSDDKALIKAILGNLLQK